MIEVFNIKESKEKIEKKPETDRGSQKRYTSPKITELGDMKRVTLQGGTETLDSGNVLGPDPLGRNSPNSSQH